jgi:dihydroorotase-like cyclic amidohydrolase
VQILIRGGTVVTCDGEDRVSRADVLVQGRDIVAVGKTSPHRMTRVIDARGCAVVP